MRAAPQQNYAFVNGRWFDGHTFRERTFYSVDGVLTSKKPKRIDSTIDLKNRYVIPPFGEAHNHNVDGANSEIIRRYLEDGIFYVKVPNMLPRARASAEAAINTPESIDAVFANGGLTASDGHPIGLVRRNIARGIWTEADAEGAFYFTIDNKDDLDRKWDQILAGKPDFIKTYLLYSEEYDKRKNDAKYRYWKGLDPALLPEIVRIAHRKGLRVSTHIESSADFHNAVVAGVDEINHMPGFRGGPNLDIPDPKVYEIAEEDARLAARKGITVVTTLGGISSFKGTLREKGDRLHSANLRMLKKHGVKVAIGSDEYRKTSAPEAAYIHSLGVYTNLELLKMWCEATPATIFPKRRIGYLKDGYEASFLVLAGNPLEDFQHTGRIEMRVKQGVILSLKD
ncbi:MAG TPA: amidohydrolase family protein [Blastocatellia bacterium]|nr:amidohydrolase family protein [Blastocatellia bacterium]